MAEANQEYKEALGLAGECAQGLWMLNLTEDLLQELNGALAMALGDTAIRIPDITTAKPQNSAQASLDGNGAQAEHA